MLYRPDEHHWPLVAMSSSAINFKINYCSPELFCFYKRPIFWNCELCASFPFLVFLTEFCFSNSWLKTFYSAWRSASENRRTTHSYYCFVKKVKLNSFIRFINSILIILCKNKYIEIKGWSNIMMIALEKGGATRNGQE